MSILAALILAVLIALAVIGLHAIRLLLSLKHPDLDQDEVRDLDDQ